MNLIKKNLYTFIVLIFLSTSGITMLSSNSKEEKRITIKLLKDSVPSANAKLYFAGDHQSDTFYTDDKGMCTPIVADNIIKADTGIVLNYITSDCPKPSSCFINRLKLRNHTYSVDLPLGGPEFRGSPPLNINISGKPTLLNACPIVPLTYKGENNMSQNGALTIALDETFCQLIMGNYEKLKNYVFFLRKKSSCRLEIEEPCFMKNPQHSISLCTKQWFVANGIDPERIDIKCKEELKLPEFSVNIVIVIK